MVMHKNNVHGQKLFKHYTVSLKVGLHTWLDCETWCSVAETKPVGHLFLYRQTPASGFWTIFCRFRPSCKSSSQFWKKKEMNWTENILSVCNWRFTHCSSDMEEIEESTFVSIENKQKNLSVLSSYKWQHTGSTLFLQRFLALWN